LSDDFLTVLARFGCDICATVERIRNFAANPQRRCRCEKVPENMDKLDLEGRGNKVTRRHFDRLGAGFRDQIPACAAALIPISRFLAVLAVEMIAQRVMRWRRGPYSICFAP
jgi:hypothetical protein